MLPIIIIDYQLYVQHHVHKLLKRNNVGVMFCPYQLSQDGIEMQFATNHLGHFHLTKLLLDKMKETAARTGIEGRIVNLSSIAHRYTFEQGTVFNKINDKDRIEMQEEGVNITVNSVHPGLIMTDLMRHSFLRMSMSKNIKIFYMRKKNFGAATTCYVSVHPNLKGVSGKYFQDCNEYAAGNFATDYELAKKLWDYNQNLVNSLQHS
ncbi:putative very-long-chain 3-oxoacyl-CoA reductase [Helianthus annuus]|nr:putative very-long-chain 3-oxoacyl-CoA reductase [Helianthus annuus]